MAGTQGSRNLGSRGCPRWRRLGGTRSRDTMRISNPPRTRTLARIRRKLRRDGPVVLLYHRVADPPTDPQLLSVVPEHFAEHLEFISNTYEPVSLAGLV